MPQNASRVWASVACGPPAFSSCRYVLHIFLVCVCVFVYSAWRPWSCALCLSAWLALCGVFGDFDQLDILIRALAFISLGGQVGGVFSPVRVCMYHKLAPVLSQLSRLHSWQAVTGGEGQRLWLLYQPVGACLCVCLSLCHFAQLRNRSGCRWGC